MRQTNRIVWLDGLKGAACLLIFVHHFLLMFYPAIHFGTGCPSKLSGLDIALSQSPLSVPVNGNYLVALFCIISGTVISLQIMNMAEKTRLGDVVFKRYFRLMLPMIPVGLLVYCMLRFDLFSHQEAALYTQSPWAVLYYQEPVSLKTAMYAVFVKTWFYGDHVLSNAFWMLKDLFYGTFFSILLSTIAWRYPRRAYAVYGIAAGILLIEGEGDLKAAFALGTLLAWLFQNGAQCFRKSSGLLLMTAGLFLGGYPSGVIPDGVYRFLNDFHYVEIHIIGAFFTLYGIWCLKGVQKMLSCSLFRKLGTISYAIYLIHIPLLFSVSTAIFLVLSDYMGYTTCVLASLVVSTALLIFTADLYHRFVEKPCEKLQNKLFAWF